MLFDKLMRDDTEHPKTCFYFFGWKFYFCVLICVQVLKLLTAAKSHLHYTEESFDYCLYTKHLEYLQCKKTIVTKHLGKLYLKLETGAGFKFSWVKAIILVNYWSCVEFCKSMYFLHWKKPFNRCTWYEWYGLRAKRTEVCWRNVVPLEMTLWL